LAGLAVRALAIVLAAALLAVGVGYLVGGERGLVASTTTSLYATGLLDVLAGEYTAETGVKVSFVAVGSGEALERAARGDACMVFVHAPSLEKRYLEEGVIEGGRIFAYNYFIIVGPASDPAGVSEARDAVDAMRRIFEAGERGEAVFVSRGDMSGTHVRELLLWRLAGLDPEGRPWYVKTGQGMGETLVVAAEMGAYTLSDTGTFLKYLREGRVPGLDGLYTGDKLLINVYSVYIASHCSGEEREWAQAFADFVAGPRGQEIIASYGVEEYGEPLFYPAAGREAELMRAWEWLASQG